MTYPYQLLYIKMDEITAAQERSQNNLDHLMVTGCSVNPHKPHSLHVSGWEWVNLKNQSPRQINSSQRWFLSFKVVLIKQT